MARKKSKKIDKLDFQSRLKELDNNSLVSKEATVLVTDLIKELQFVDYNKKNIQDRLNEVMSNPHIVQFFKIEEISQKLDRVVSDLERLERKIENIESDRSYSGYYSEYH
jgi:polyhydroxyalkanoate synthesis regulator phasin